MRPLIFMPTPHSAMLIAFHVRFTARLANCLFHSAMVLLRVGDFPMLRKKVAAFLSSTFRNSRCEAESLHESF